ncbi:E3 ubiquitin/ISG15 ligase TRIM25-like [Triplophysa rosa]|uniref:E3 ubiquitin/ISG15 ligase TRIM25-like n=1 Tax=Triplophysa rosa TaxID=992332 RepID=A0A9W7WD51_TRIRA|nr:E3 ubiquitin/ISG15 ligase TRIM25-like [Triplophysa rosa]KAI7794599.1 putative E3 ubiquitin/ISG15 ligase TRIM25-like [Triplophysa rosa]
MSQSKPEERLTLELSCPICLQLYRDPVALPCGHNYCLGCIQNAVDAGDPKHPMCCPECREEYSSPKTLARNFKLSGIVDGYLAAMSGGRLRADPSIPCDHCLDDPVAAVKFCTCCEMSLCSGHLECHKDHMLVEVSAEQGGKRCPVHRKTTEYLCMKKRLFLCSDCLMEGTHQNHDVQTFEVAKEEMKSVLVGMRKTVSDKLQMTEALLRNAIEREGLDKVEDKLVGKANILLENMSTLISAYKSRMRTLMEDELHLRDKSWQANLSDLEGCQQLLREAHQSTQEVLSESSEFVFIQHFLNIEARVRQAANITIPGLPAQERFNGKHLRTTLRTDNFRAEMNLLLDCLHAMMNPLDLTFNPATAHPGLLLSTDLKTVKQCGGGKSGSAGDHSERFTTAAQVMCSQGFSTGVHMWTVEIGPGCMWSVGLCYKSILRKGDHSKLGHNSSSWRLQWKSKKLTACYDSVNVPLGDGLIVPPKKVEVTLDYEGGTVAFHSTGHGGRKQHLHTFSALFKDVVYPAFGIHSTSEESWITLSSAA